MSNRKHDPENKFEYFSTPTSVVNDLLNLGVLIGSTSVLEPCAGTGNIIKTLRQTGYDHHITAVEINQDHEEKCLLTSPDLLVIGNFLNEKLINEHTIGTFDLIICNPPFSNIERFIEKCWHLLNFSGQLCVILRLGHLVGVKRGKFLRTYRPSSINILSHRPSFTEGVLNSGDIGGYCWLIWEKPLIEPHRDTIVKWIRPENPDWDRRNNVGDERTEKKNRMIINQKE